MQNLVDLFTESESVNIVVLGLDLILSALLSGFVYIVYVYFGSTISSRRHFGKIFFLVAVCTTLIIAVIKSSIALSLGLVGALSIVRFRAAIKEPEELAYLFLCVAIGLGFGAGLRTVTLFGTILILIIIVLRGAIFRKDVTETYNLSVHSIENVSLETVTNVLANYTDIIRLRRADSHGTKVTYMYSVEFKSVQKLETAINELRKIDDSIIVSFISNETLI